MMGVHGGTFQKALSFPFFPTEDTGLPDLDLSGAHPEAPILSLDLFIK